MMWRFVRFGLNWMICWGLPFNLSTLKHLENYLSDNHPGQPLIDMPFFKVSNVFADHLSVPSALKQFLSTLSSLTVRNEYCQQVADDGGLEMAVSILSNEGQVCSLTYFFLLAFCKKKSFFVNFRPLPFMGPSTSRQTQLPEIKLRTQAHCLFWKYND